MKDYFDPRTRSDADLQKEVNQGKMSDFRRSDVGGIYKYIDTSDGSTIIKDIEPADNEKGHQQVDFRIDNGQISNITVHND